MKKMQLFEEVLFELKDRSMEQTFVPKHPKLRRTIHGLINTLARHDSYDELELHNTAVTMAWEALESFTLKEGADWDAIIAGRDTHNLNRIVKAIIAKIEHELPAIANPNTKRMYDAETGGKMYVTINFESLDRPVYGEDGEVVGSLMDEVSESFFAPTYTYSKNPFVAWFQENRNDFLTRRQNSFIDGLSTGLLKKDSDYIEESDLEELAGMKANEMDHMKKRIRDRALKDWEEYRKTRPETTRRGASLAEKVRQYSEFIAMAESDDSLSDQNARLSAWLKSSERLSGDDPVDFVYDLFAKDITATKSLTSFLQGKTESIDAAVLYQIYEAFVAEIERLKDEIASLEVGSTSTYRDTETKQRNTERKRKYKEFTEVQPCYVYDAAGEHVRTLDSDLKDYKIVELNAFGMAHDTRD